MSHIIIFDMRVLALCSHHGTFGGLMEIACHVCIKQYLSFYSYMHNLISLKYVHWIFFFISIYLMDGPVRPRRVCRPGCPPANVIFGITYNNAHASR